MSGQTTACLVVAVVAMLRPEFAVWLIATLVIVLALWGIVDWIRARV